MTEKRFSMFGDMANIKQYVLDRKDNSRMSSKLEMLNKLNELADENEQLKNKNEELKQENRKLKEDLGHCANQFTNDGKNVLLSLR